MYKTSIGKKSKFVLIILLIIALPEQANSIYSDIEPPLSYFESSNVWYNHDIRINLTAYDALSGIAAISYTIDGSLPYVSYSPEAGINLSSEGIHEIQYSSLDNANNAEPVRKSLIKLDFTAPKIYISSPASKDYLHSDIIALNFSGIDGLSGIDSLIASIDGKPLKNAQEFDMLSLTLGRHEFTVRTSDLAGNIAVTKVYFNVTSNIDSLIALNKKAVKNEWITSEETARSLDKKLTQAKQKIDNSQRESANNILKEYINEIDTRMGKTITAEGAYILTTEAVYVYICNFNLDYLPGIKI